MRHTIFRFVNIAKALAARFFLPNRLSVGWILCGDKTVGSSRIHGLNIHSYLLSLGINSFVINQPSGYVESLRIYDFEINAILKCHFDIVVFQRVFHGRALELIRMLKRQGTKTVFFAADLYESEVLGEVDHVFTVSVSLKEMLVKRGLDERRLHVIHDAIETSQELCKTYTGKFQSLIKLVWVGAAGHWNTLQEIRRILEQDERLNSFRLVTISNHPEADIAWSLDTVWAEILQCDVGVVPVDLGRPESIVKSNNRVTMFKALGMPVICSRLPSYEDAIVDGVTGFFADTQESWTNSLLKLLDPATRESVGLAGRDSIFETYGVDAVGSGFLRLLQDMTNSRS